MLRFEQVAVEGETAASRPLRLPSYVANGDTYTRNARHDCNPVAVATLHTFVFVIVINCEPTISLKVLTRSIGPGFPLSIAHWSYAHQINVKANAPATVSAR